MLVVLSVKVALLLAWPKNQCLILVFQGPSEEALEGKCGIFASPNGIMVDDYLSQDVRDLICGTYIVKTGIGGKFQ
jgi:hypothetical protein